MRRKNPAGPCRLGALLACTLLGGLPLASGLHAQDRSGPLVIGTDLDYPPFASESPTGGYEGFACA